MENFQVTDDGKPQPKWDAALRELIDHESPMSYGKSSINGVTIPPDRLVTMMNLNDSELTERILNEFDRLDFKACFCSIFNECWTTSHSAFGATQQVENCQRSDSSFAE